MPTEGKILGFTNRWYPEGFEKSVTTKLHDGQEIRIFALPYLIASKIEAFKGRGKKDYIGSTDMEDIVALLDGAPDFQEQTRQVPVPLRAYLRENFRAFLHDERLLDALEGYFPSGGREDRIQRIKMLLQES